MGKKQGKGNKKGNRDEEVDEEGQGEMGKEQKIDDCVDIEALAAEIEGAEAAKKTKGKKKKGAKKNDPFEEDDIIKELNELSLETQGGTLNKHTTKVESVVPPKPEKTRKKGKKGNQDKEGDEEEGRGDMEKIKDQKDEKAPVPIASDSGSHSHQKDKKTDKNKKKGPSKSSVKLIKELMAKQKEEEERVKREEEEKQKRLIEQEQQRLEQERLEQEMKENKKQKERERRERLKKEGKLLTKAQKEDRARAQATLKILQAQGVEVPSKASVLKKKQVYGDKRKRIATKTPKETSEVSSPVSESLEAKMETETVTKPAELLDKPDTEVNDWEAITNSDDDNWEAIVTSDEEKDLRKVHIEVKETSAPAQPKQSNAPDNTSEVEGEDEDNEKSNEEEKIAVEKGRRGQRDKKGKKSERESSREHGKHAENICNINLDKLRAPVVCVLGHVDTGKTKILDKLRHTQVQDGEAGGITQQIGATNVPLEAIIEQAKMVQGFDKDKIKIPGMLIIDTPGHESFCNLRNRGSSMCDIAILVVDIMHGLEKQTLESINLLRKKKVPFIVALNKIDCLYDWKKSPETDIVATLKNQQRNTTDQFNTQVKEITLEFNKEALNVALFHENKDPKTYVSLVPTSAKTGDGIGNIIALLVELSQIRLAKTLVHSDELSAQIMEVKALPGMGITIDVILINGCLREGETIIVPGVDGAIVTQIRGLLLPPPMKELRVTNQYEKHKEVCTSQGVRIMAKNLEKTLAGLPLLVAHRDDEIPVLKKELETLVTETMNAFAAKKEKKGVYVQASTMGSLEALLDFLHASKVPYAGFNIGPVHKNDIMTASTMLEHDPQYAVILAFDVKVEREIQEMADSLGVRVFSADIIYHLFDAFTKYREDYKAAKQEEFKHIAVFPVKMKIIPRSIFNSRDPILIGVTVEEGILRLGTPLCVPSKGSVDIGIVTGIEVNHKPMDSAKKGQDICVKIDSIPGESPKMVGRHFEETDLIVSKISRESIDALKNWFREDMKKSDWQLIKELKTTFEII